MLNKVLLSCFCSFALATQAWAESALHENAGEIKEAVDHAADIKHASSGGLPQFDPTWFPSQIFWLAVTFVILYVFFAKKTLPEISNVLENRKNHIQSDLEMAEKITAEADQVHEMYQADLNKAQSDAAQAIQEVESQIKTKSADAFEAFRERSETEIKAAEDRIKASQTTAMDDMNNIAAEAASAAVEKIIGTSTDVNQVKAVIDNMHGKAKAA